MHEISSLAYDPTHTYIRTHTQIKKQSLTTTTTLSNGSKRMQSTSQRNETNVLDFHSWVAHYHFFLPLDTHKKCDTSTQPPLYSIRKEIL